MSSAKHAWPKDITQEDIQSYLEMVYASRNAPQHQPLRGVKNRCKESNAGITSANSASMYDMLSFPQSVVHTVMSGIAHTPETPNRGLLVWHSVGSGKTLTATCVVDAFWDTDKNIVFATSVEASNSNPPSNFYKLAAKFLPRFKGMSVTDIEKSFQKRNVKFFTFATLAHYLLIANPLKTVKSAEDIERHRDFLKNAVIIIDEVHNIFKPLPNQKLENDAIRQFLTDYQNPRTENLKIVILTATPGDTPTDVVNLLNMVRSKTAPPIEVPRVNDPFEVDTFAKSIRGLISYFDMSKDYSRFPKVYNTHVIKSPMTVKQFQKYSEIYNQEKSEWKDMNALMKQNMTGNYYKHARRYSNMLYDFENDMMLNEFSTKMPLLLETILGAPREKHYVYSAFYENRGFGGHGVLAIARVLEKHFGYEKLTLSMANKIVSEPQSVQKKPRYLLAVSSELGDDRENLKKLVNAFNTSGNAYGEYVHVFLASQGYNEGLDLKAVRHIHIFEPLLTYAADKQTIGRAARFCSHSDLNMEKGEWTVRVHRYISDMPTMDMSQFNLNYIRDRLAYLEEWKASLEKRLGHTPSSSSSSSSRRKQPKSVKKVNAQDSMELGLGQVEDTERKNNANTKDKNSPTFALERVEETQMTPETLNANTKIKNSLNVKKYPQVNNNTFQDIDQLKNDERSIQKAGNASMRRELEKDLKQVNEMIKELKKKQTEVAKMNIKNIEMIDQKISAEAYERTKELLTMYNIMKKSAIDYYLFKDYHENAE